MFRLWAVALLALAPCISPATFTIAGDGFVDNRAQVTSITPDAFDLTKSLPTAFTIAGQQFADTGFGLPVVNFTRAERLVGQARASSLIGGTTLTVPFPTDSTSLKGPLTGLSTAGAVLVQVYNETGRGSYLLIGSIALTVTDSRPTQGR